MKYDKRTDHPLFRRWTGIRQAMLNPNSPDYVWAGAKGIKCKHLNDFEQFADMVEGDIGELPSDELKLHRIDLNKGWYPGNLVWATQAEVSKSQTKNIFITIGKQTQNITDWADKFSVNYWTAWRRYKKGFKGKEIFYHGKNTHT